MKYTKRVLALFLIMCMVFTSMPLDANATEGTPAETAIDSEQSSEDTVTDDVTSDGVSEEGQSEETGTPVEDESDTDTESNDSDLTDDSSENGEDSTQDGDIPENADNVDLVNSQITGTDSTEDANTDNIKSDDVSSEVSVSKASRKLKSVVPATTSLDDVEETAAVTVADDTTDYLFFATDRHTNTSVIGNIINNMESAIGENKLDYSGYLHKFRK